MGDPANSTHVNIAQKTENKPEPLPRHIYLALRLKELAAELQALVAERQGLNATLKDRSGQSSNDVRQMRERRGYVAVRINMLRSEQQGLVAEKDLVAPPASADGGGTKKPN